VPSFIFHVDVPAKCERCVLFKEHDVNWQPERHSVFLIQQMLFLKH